ncbi:hypothetical protein [Methanobacterium petrolearium]|uniref:hypothetical protein n=1 Tax=Methanobacterium petrolearium TaxID=710190 RepID=UPI001AEAA484|nr:hypothetical protein [Methanobacterium petrolearium]MBP1946448.1 hypothetical protein [Methanobacterium petrolearium]BDZ70524.1 hypothetical protein GCM10025861_10410 [Methanobacterium petrolearium]
MVLNSVRVFQSEYPEKIPYNILKLDLNIPEENLASILGYLGEKGYISHQDGVIILKKESKMDQEANIPEKQSKENGKVTDEHEGSNLSVDDNEGKVDEAGHKNQLSEKEQRSLEIIKGLVNEEGNISRTLLEGTLLYGELELSDISMYNLITSLENKSILRKIQLTDGEYYHFTS